MFLSRYACTAGVFTLSGLLVAGITVNDWCRSQSLSEVTEGFLMALAVASSGWRHVPAQWCVMYGTASLLIVLFFCSDEQGDEQTFPPMIRPSLHHEFVKQRLCLRSAKLSYCKCLQKVRAFVRERPGWKLDEKNVVAELPCRNLLCSDLNVLQKRARLPDSSLWCFSGSVCSGVCPFRNCWHVEISTWWAVLPRMELTVHLLLSAPSLLRT